MQDCKKLTQKIKKRLAFITLVMWLLKKIANCNIINSVNPLYLIINEMIGHFAEKNENKYLVLDDVDENKEVLQKYGEVWEGVKKEIETSMVAKKLNIGKIFKKLGLNLTRICH